MAQMTPGGSKATKEQNQALSAMNNLVRLGIRKVNIRVDKLCLELDGLVEELAVSKACI